MDKFGDVKVGDKVIVFSRTNKEVGEVVKVGKVSFNVEGSTTKNIYNKRDGWVRGGSAWSRSWVEPATEEEIAKINRIEKKRKLIYILKDKIDYNELSIDELENLYEIVRKHLN